MKNRHVALFLSVVMVFCVFSCLFVSASNNSDLSVLSTNAYIASLDLDVSLADISITNDYLYYVSETSENQREVTYILSYNETSDGLNRVSPADYLANDSTVSTQSTGQYPVTFPKYTAYVTIGYTRYNGNYSWYIYKPYSVSAYWTSDTVTSNIAFSASYGSRGQLCSYPTCLNPSDYDDMVDTIVSSDYNHVITASSDSLAPNRNIIGGNSLASDRAIWFENSVLHGSVIHVEIGSYNDDVDLGVYY